MGESSDTPLKLQFDRRVRLDFRGATITSDAGLLACPELGPGHLLNIQARKPIQVLLFISEIAKVQCFAPGNVHSAEWWREVLEPVVKRYQEKGVRLLFRADAAFAKPDVYEYLESRDTGYAMRLPANEVLQGNIRHLLKRPVGRPPKKPVVRYHDFVYQAQSWDIPRRVGAKVEWHQGELFPRVGFVVTNLNLPPEGVTHFYNGRGTAEQWIKEGKYALNWTRLSCHRFVANQVRLWLFVLAYNLGNFMRRLTLPESVKHWSLRSVQTKLIKMGGRLVRHARRLVFQLAEVAVAREVFRQVLERIAGLHPAPG